MTHICIDDIIRRLKRAGQQRRTSTRTVPDGRFVRVVSLVASDVISPLSVSSDWPVTSNEDLLSHLPH